MDKRLELEKYFAIAMIRCSSGEKYLKAAFSCFSPSVSSSRQTDLTSLPAPAAQCRQQRTQGEIHNTEALR